MVHLISFFLKTKNVINNKLINKSNIISNNDCIMKLFNYKNKLNKIKTNNNNSEVILFT